MCHVFGSAQAKVTKAVAASDKARTAATQAKAEAIFAQPSEAKAYALKLAKASKRLSEARAATKKAHAEKYKAKQAAKRAAKALAKSKAAAKQVPPGCEW